MLPIFLTIQDKVDLCKPREVSGQIPLITYSYFFHSPHCNFKAVKTSQLKDIMTALQRLEKNRLEIESEIKDILANQVQI